jgi:hypothetical protein
MQIGEVADLAVVERAALALLSGRLAWVPHVVVGDQLTPTLERLQQRDRPVWAGQRDGGIDLHHWQPPAGCGQRVTGPRVGLLPHKQLIPLGLVGDPVDYRG